MRRTLTQIIEDRADDIGSYAPFHALPDYEDLAETVLVNLARTNGSRYTAQYHDVAYLARIFQALAQD